VWIETPEILEAGKEYDLAVTFGSDGLRIYIDGELQASKAEFKQGLLLNTADLAIGANIWGRDAEHPNSAQSFFDGTISNFTIYGSQLNAQAVATLANPPSGSPVIADREDYAADGSEAMQAVDEVFAALGR
jgi:Concanavalin A-like lectin/glucanases superfamily